MARLGIVSSCQSRTRTPLSSSTSSTFDASTFAARAAQSVGLLAWFVSLFLSRAGPPPEVLPETLRTIGDWLPLTPIVAMLQEPWLTGEWLTQQSLVTVGIAMVSAGVAWFAYRWE